MPHIFLQHPHLDNDASYNLTTALASNLKAVNPPDTSCGNIRNVPSNKWVCVQEDSLERVRYLPHLPQHACVGLPSLLPDPQDPAPSVRVALLIVQSDGVKQK